MKQSRHILMAALLTHSLFAAVPVTPGKDQLAMLKSSDPKLAANKKVCYDFFRVILRGLHLDEADKYMTEGYIQHNPNADTGMKGFKEFFMKRGAPKPVENTVPGLVAIQAEGEYVTLSFVREYDNPKEKGKKYTTTWFDMFRVVNGKIVEHWDSAMMQ